MNKKLYGAIEAGGTKIVCAVAISATEIIEKITINTTTPNETMGHIIEFFAKFKNQIVSFGIGCFGPIDINKKSKTYGYILNTPKIKWQNFNFIEKINNSFNVPIYWTTDVNVAAYGELKHGFGKNKNSCVYYTVGTGVGGGAVQNKTIIGGFTHTEMGHMLVLPHPKDHFTGSCPFHKYCLEGMVAGPSVEKRYGIKGQNLPEDHEVWSIIAYYLAQCAHNTTLMLSPDVIIFGGGVMEQKQIIKHIRKEFKIRMNNYVNTPALTDYIVTPHLQCNAGIIGCIALAQNLA